MVPGNQGEIARRPGPLQRDGWSDRRGRCIDHCVIVCHRLTHRTLPFPTYNRGIRIQARWCRPGTGSLHRLPIRIREPDRRFSCACDSRPLSFHTLPTGAAFYGLLGFRGKRASSVRFQPCQVSTVDIRRVIAEAERAPSGLLDGLLKGTTT